MSDITRNESYFVREILLRLHILAHNLSNNPQYIWTEGRILLGIREGNPVPAISAFLSFFIGLLLIVREISIVLLSTNRK